MTPIRERFLNTVADILKDLRPGDDEDTVFQRQAAEAHIRELLCQPAPAEVTALTEALESMLGWALYGEDCDPWYFSKDRAPDFTKDVEKARKALAAAKGGKG